MTNPSGDSVARPGWYDDPAGTDQKRWWDGAAWTAQLHDPSLEVHGAAARPVVGASTPVYNVFIWLITFLPLLSVISLVAFDFDGYVRASMAGTLAMLSPSYLLITALGWILYLVIVLLAFFDRSRLARDGFARPFHWAWAFLSGPVYLIGRSVIVRRRSGRGLLPVWAWIAVTLISIIVAIVKVVGAMAVIIADLPLSYN